MNPPALSRTAVTPLLDGSDAVVLGRDGTLVDTLGDFHVALTAALQEIAGLVPRLHRLTPQAVEAMVGKGSEHLIRQALAHVLPEAAELRATQADTGREEALQRLFAPAFSAYQKHYARINGLHAHTYPGVEPGLAALARSGRPLACLTNKPQSFAQELLARKNLLGCFVHVFGGDSFERKKPDPLPLLKTCEALGTRPERTLMVGDSVNDAQAARAAGCRVVLVSYGYNHGLPVASVDADGCIDSLADLA